MENNTRERLKKLDATVRKLSSKEKSGHDYSHVKRVEKNALDLAKDYPKIDRGALIAACLIHDLKKEDNCEKVLKQVGFNQEDTTKIKDIAIQFRHIGKL